jgi:hypothetical protein
VENFGRVVENLACGGGKHPQIAAKTGLWWGVRAAIAPPFYKKVRNDRGLFADNQNGGRL